MTNVGGLTSLSVVRKGHEMRVLSNVVIILITAMYPFVVAEEPAAVLSKHGVTVRGSILVIDGEKEFRAQMAKAPRVRKLLADAISKYVTAEKTKAALEREVTMMEARNGQLNTQLANVRSGDVATNNRLVGMINANISAINLKREQLQNGEKFIDKLRAEASQAREDFIAYVLESREVADSVEATRTKAVGNADVKAALKTLNAAGGKYSLDEPSRSFRSIVRKLTDLEAKVLTENIPIRRDAGGTANVTVTINGGKAMDMIVDSGASLISLPPRHAEQAGIRPGPDDPQITLTLADGRQIQGRLVKLKTVRVGQFEVEDVECAVLGPDAINAEPLLGMSFLGEFEFQLNSAKETLTLTRIQDETRSSRRRR